MRIETKVIEIYTYEEASQELKEKIREHFRNDHNLYEHCMHERIDTLKEFAQEFNLEVDYSISCVPDRVEKIKFKTKDEYRTIKELVKEISDFNTPDKDCPFTGVCYDHDILHVLVNISEHNIFDKLEKLERTYLDSIHDEYESMLTDEYISEMCEANEYEFTNDGIIY